MKIRVQSEEKLEPAQLCSYAVLLRIQAGQPGECEMMDGWMQVPDRR